MQQNTDTEKDLQLRELDAMCVNESHLQHKWYHNLKLLNCRSFIWHRVRKSRSSKLVFAYRKCFVCSRFICME